VSVSSLKNVVTGNFISGLSRVATRSSSSITTNNKPTLDVTLRTGARNFAAGLQALNLTISYVNISRQANERLLQKVTEADLLLAKAAKGGIGSQEADLMRMEFSQLARDFQKIVKNSSVEGRDPLSSDDLSELLIKSGLDPAKNDELRTAFTDFKSLTRSSAEGEEPTSTGNLKLPANEFSHSVGQASAANDASDRDGTAVSAVFKGVRDTLKNIRARLEDNLKALEGTAEVIGKNIDLARAAGFALLDLSQTVKGTEEADALALKVREEIRRRAPGALSQSDNLNNLLVAGLTITPTTFTSK